MNVMNKFLGSLGVLLVLIMSIAPQSVSAAGLGWVLNGTVFNAATCAPLQGVNASSPYNGYAFNISNSRGYYYLVLGTGNWSVSFAKTGFVSGYYQTPYETNGAFFHNVSLVPVGGTAKTCGKNTTVINATTSVITPGSTNTTGPTTSVSAGGGAAAGGLSTTEIVGIIVVIVVIIAIVAYAMRGKGGHKKGSAQA